MRHSLPDRLRLTTMCRKPPPILHIYDLIRPIGIDFNAIFTYIISTFVLTRIWRTKMDNNNAIIYCRKSRDDDGNTLEMQLDRLEAYCKMQGLNIVKVIQERGVSGTTPLERREGGKEALELIQSGNANHIIALKLDRLFRNTVDCCTWTNRWTSEGVHLHLVDMGGTSLNTASSVGNLFITLIAAFAQFERDTLAERTSASLQHRKKNQKVYNHCPYGYDRSGNDLVENDAEQQIISEVREARANGATLSSIADMLNKRSICGKQGGKWTATSIRNVVNFTLAA